MATLLGKPAKSSSPSPTTMLPTVCRLLPEPHVLNSTPQLHESHIFSPPVPLRDISMAVSTTAAAPDTDDDDDDDERQQYPSATPATNNTAITHDFFNNGMNFTATFFFLLTRSVSPLRAPTRTQQHPSPPSMRLLPTILL